MRRLNRPRMHDLDCNSEEYEFSQAVKRYIELTEQERLVDFLSKKKKLVKSLPWVKTPEKYKEAYRFMIFPHTTKKFPGSRGILRPIEKNKVMSWTVDPQCIVNGHLDEPFESMIYDQREDQFVLSVFTCNIADNRFYFDPVNLYDQIGDEYREQKEVISYGKVKISGFYSGVIPINGWDRGGLKKFYESWQKSKKSKNK